MDTYTFTDAEGEPKYTRLFSGSDDFTIRVWDTKTGVCFNVFNGHKSGILCMSFLDGKLYSGSYDHYVIVWNL